MAQRPAELGPGCFGRHVKQSAVAMAQRGAKRQPSSRSHCPGTTPGIAGRRSLVARSGSAASRAAV